MLDDALWELWWEDIKYLAPSIQIEEAIEESIQTYREYFELGYSPAQAYYEHWE